MLRNALLGFLLTIVAVEPAIALECYTRSYASPHLSKHPHQTVTSISLIVGKSVTYTSAYTALISLQRRGSQKVLSTGLGCTTIVDERGTMSCSVDCDGGSFDLKRAADGSHLHLHLNTPLVLSEGCGLSDEEEDAFHILEPGLDDRVFRLNRARPEQCEIIKARHPDARAAFGQR